MKFLKIPYGAAGKRSGGERSERMIMTRRIAILGGTGAEGSGLAYRWAKAGEQVLIGSRDAGRATETAKQLRGRIGGAAQIEGMDNASAAAACDVAVMTVPFSGAAVLLKQAATVGGAATRTLGVWQGSAAEQTKELLPPGVSLAAALQNLGAASLASDGPVECDVLVCSDDEKAKQVASELVGKIPGARALNGGKLENARIVESLTALLIGLNMRYKVHGAGIRFTGLPLK